MSKKNDAELMAAMAKLLPELEVGPSGLIYWRMDKFPESDHPEKFAVSYRVLDTEWLHIMNLIERAMKIDECYRYNDAVAKELGSWTPRIGAANWPFHASFNQRARAMLSVKRAIKTQGVI